MLSTDSVNEIDMSKVTWIDANMCAPFGAILYSYFNSTRNDRKRLIISNMNDDVKSILKKNGFLSDFFRGEKRSPDIYKTTIEYRKFERHESLVFKDYVERHFVEEHIGNLIPGMSIQLQKEFRKSIFEIFENSVYHSETELGIFACGQYFPKKGVLIFSVADLGIGIRDRIYNCLGLNMSPERAISWAVDEENTTRPLMEGIPGGLGLKLIKNFIYVNGGDMIIVSDRGYWKFKRGKEQSENMILPFPGTVVSITLNAPGNADLSRLYDAIPKSIF